MAGVLSHLRVLDLSRILAGPWASQMLGDMGADVIKVERPGTGDDTRGWGPPFVDDHDGKPTHISSYYLCANRNKRSITVDIAHPEGQKLLRELVKQSDVLIENYKVGGLRQYGLDYESLRTDNPALVYCSITGFGQDGPYASRPGYDFLMQGLGGLMSLTGAPDEVPTKVGVALTDILTGVNACSAILAAIVQRDENGFRSGNGQYIDLALLDVQVASLANQATSYLATGVSPSRMGNAHPSIVPYQDFPTADGHIILAIGNDAQFARFCEVAGCEAIATDLRYATNAARVENRGILIEILQGITVKRPSAEWIRALEAAGVPCGPINTLQDVFSDPQVTSRNLRLDMPHLTAGQISLVASPLRFSTNPVEYRRPPPELGEHTVNVLQDVLGLDERTIARMRIAGVI